MRMYCGEVLPYPSSCAQGKISAKIVTSSSGNYTYLEIRDESPDFSFKDYYLDLEKNGWGAIRSYKGEAVQTDEDGIDYVELTKASAEKGEGYDIIYFHDEGGTDANGNVVKAGSVVRCYNDLSIEARADSEWTEAEKSQMESALTIALPFMKIGGYSIVSQYSLDALQIVDNYYKDLTKDYMALLVADGYVHGAENTAKYGGNYLVKTLSDGSSVGVLLSYYGGNRFLAYYTPNSTSSSSWPSSFVSKIKERTGVEIPEFDLASGGEFRTYEKNGSYYVITESDTPFGEDGTKPYYNYVNNVLLEPGLTWEETAEISYFFLKNGDEEALGFGLCLTPTAPTSTFFSSWPKKEIDDAIENVLGIEGFSLPSLDDAKIPSTGKSPKYQIRDEEYCEKRYQYYCQDIPQWPYYYGLEDNPSDEEVKAVARELAEAEKGIFIEIYDDDYQAYKAYFDTLYQQGWCAWAENGDDIYEDPEGKIAVTLSVYSTESTIFIHEGSKKQHTPEFHFKKEIYEIGNGKSGFVDLIKTMLPYDVSYSSSDETGKIAVDDKGEVTVSSDAEEGMTATITATINVPGEETPRTATCTIKVTKSLNYTNEIIKDYVASALTAKGYSVSTTPTEIDPGEYTYSSKVNLGSMSLDDAKAMVKSGLIPEGFALLDDYDWEEDPYDEVAENAQVITYFYQEGIDGSDTFILKFYVYQSEGDTILVAVNR